MALIPMAIAFRLIYFLVSFLNERTVSYESQVRQQVEEGNHGKIVAIDIETGAFEVADDILPATDRLFERLPDAQPWIVRIGYRAVDRFGARSLKNS
jgi:hypothetical protein